MQCLKSCFSHQARKLLKALRTWHLQSHSQESLDDSQGGCINVIYFKLIKKHNVRILYSTLRGYVPFGRTEELFTYNLPYSFRNFQKAETRNQTMRCSFCNPLGRELKSLGQLGGMVVLFFSVAVMF